MMDKHIPPFIEQKAYAQEIVEKNRSMEVGHAIQNACLQAISLGLGSVVIGAFNDTEMKHVMKLDKAKQPHLLLPVGKNRAF
jgi:nitroreductase